MIGAFQTNARTTLNKANNAAAFDTNHLIKDFVENDGVRYPKDGVLTIFEENSYLDYYRYLKLFTKEYVGEELLQPYISYPNMKDNNLFQITDLRHQVDHITPKKTQLFEEISQDPDNERLFLILARRRQVEMISDGYKLIEVKVI